MARRLGRRARSPTIDPGTAMSCPVLRSPTWSGTEEQEEPYRLAYDMAVVYDDAPGFDTTVEVTIEAVPDGHRIRLVQQGFLTMEVRDDFAGAWPNVLDELARRVCARRSQVGGPCA